jgi:PAS domain S-box-containing protein
MKGSLESSKNLCSEVVVGLNWIQAQKEMDWPAVGLPLVTEWDPALIAAMQMIAYASGPTALIIGEAGIIVANPHAQRLLGEKIGGKINGRSVSELLTENFSFYEGFLKRAFAGEGLTIRDQPIRLGINGQEVSWFHLDLIPIPNAAGGFEGVMVTASSVSEYREHIRNLSESEQRLRLALDGSGMVGVWTLDLATGLTTSDANVARMYGLPEIDCRNGIHDTLFIRAIHPDDRAKVKANLIHTIETGSPYRCRYRVVGGGDSIRWVITSAKPYRDENGKVSRLLGAVVDVTDQMATATALAESQFHFQTLTEALPQIVWSCGADGRHDYFSTRWSEFTGISQADITEETWKHLVFPDHWAMVSQAWEDARVTGKPYDIDYRFRHHSGEYRWLRVMALPIKDETGNLTRWFGTSTDIHDTQLMAEERQRLSHELERNLERLSAAKQAAEAAERAKSNFLAIMSHEIRTPMNGILLGIEGLLSHTDLDDDQQEMADVISRSAQSLLHIINDILDFSKIEAGKLEITPVGFSLQSSIEEITKLLTPVAQQKKLILKQEIDSLLKMTPLWGDEGRIRQVITNLVGNALKFTQAGGSITTKARVTISTSSTMTLRVSVHDTGIGIPDEVQAKLFQPFTQANAMTARRYGGSGLGLSICRQIITLMGGEIGVISTPMQGSEFWFSLTLDKRTQSAASTASRALKPFPTKSSRALSLLVADDNSINCTVVNRILTSMGHRVELVADGTDVLERLARQSYDIIFMDCQMSELGGCETTRLIRTGASDIIDPNIWIIGLTASATQEVRKECLEAGMNDFLTKPIQIQEISFALERAITGQTETVTAHSRHC